VIGWALVLLTAASYELWAELTHSTTLTAATRALPVQWRFLLAFLGLALLLHLLIPQSWARHDPIDNLEHRFHDLSHEMKGGG
jgi:hypothetical protein